MSLETDIQNLTKAIESLVAALNKTPITVDLFEQPQLQQPEVEQTTEVLETIEEPAVEEPAPVPAPEVKKIKLEDLQSACAELLRKDINNKNEIRKVLETYKATKLSDIKESQYADLMQQLGNI